MYFVFNVCYIPFIPLSSKSSAEEMEEMSFFHFLPPVRKKVISSGRNSTLLFQGRPQDLGGGGGKNIFFRIGNLHVILLKGFGGMLPRQNFLKRCNLVRFRVYFDKILSIFFFQKLPFFT